MGLDMRQAGDWGPLILTPEASTVTASIEMWRIITGSDKTESMCQCRNYSDDSVWKSSFMQIKVAGRAGRYIALIFWGIIWVK